jgi:hypothetical protein
VTLPNHCSETGFLEFHHVVPYAKGGEATPSNIELRCRAHNAYEAEQQFGTLFVREQSDLREGRTRSGPSPSIGPSTARSGQVARKECCWSISERAVQNGLKQAAAFGLR